MKWIDTSDLKLWATKPNSKFNLPLLISRLIRATSTKVINLKIPKGKSIYRGGWDGIVISGEETEFIPEGISLWEFGTESNILKKINGDYQKRSNDPLGKIPKESTFVFVTPHIWEEKEEWIKEKLKDKIWKDIKIYDGQKLEEWLLIAPIISYWLANQIGTMPNDGVESIEDFWENWSSGPYKLLPKILTIGRENESNEIKSRLLKSPAIIPVQASSRDEAIAFIIASGLQFETEEKETFLSKSLIIENLNTFKILITNKDSIFLIPKFEGTSTLNNAVLKGHHVILPLGADDIYNNDDKIVLPRVNRDGFLKALNEIGIDDEEAKKISKETSRNITVFRRYLNYENNQPVWAKRDNAREIIPALLAGRWDEAYAHDKIIIEKIAGEPYDSYIRKLTTWINCPDSPIYKIGDKWRVSSPLDSWSHLSRYITNSDLENLASCFLDVTREIKPFFDLEGDKRFMASLYGKVPKHSSWIREGLSKSLIIIAIYGDNLKIAHKSPNQNWVNSIINQLLLSDEKLLWCSLTDVMPLIAEASPSCFIKAVNRSLSSSDKSIMGMFEEFDSFITPTSYHTGLLWALENLAWDPEYFSRVTLILGTLDSLDPGGRLSNRPINSLRGIFLPWYPQTFETVQGRMESLQLLRKNQPEIAWKLGLMLLPKPHDVGHQSHTCSYRYFDKKIVKGATYVDIFNFYSQLTDLLISFTNYDETKIGEIVERCDNFTSSDRKKILDYLKINLNKIAQNKFTIWHRLRKLLHFHKSYPDYQKRLVEDELKFIEELYIEYSPKDAVNQNLWMFNQHWLEFEDGFDRDEISYEEQERIVQERRIEGLGKIHKEIGIDKIISLSREVKEPWILGETLAFIITSEKEKIKICKLLKSNDSHDTNVALNFIRRNFFTNNFEWIRKLFKQLQSLGFTNKELSKIFIPIVPNKELCNFLESHTNKEIQDGFWSVANPPIYHLSPDEKEFAIKKFLEYKRYIFAIHECRLVEKDISSSLLIEVLEKGGTEKGVDENIKLQEYEIESLFKELDSRNDFDSKALIRLEWIYLTILSSYGNIRSPKLLHQELSKNPDFFIEVLKWTYKPDKEEQIEEEFKKMDSEQIIKRADKAYSLLQSWKILPGMNESFKMDFVYLNEWITKVRSLADQCGRLSSADGYIGKILAEFPEGKYIWPPNEICEIIDKINTTSLKDNFRASTSNKRSFSSKSPFEGGERERKIAGYFRELAKSHASKWPFTSEILFSLAENYDRDAKLEDDRATQDDLEY